VPEKMLQANKITASMKGLNKQLQAEEEPRFTVPGIWDNGEQQHSTLCDIIVTNQRIFGYIYKKFPRERLFLDALNLSEITNVAFRQKEHEPLFRELLIETESRKVYVRAPRNKIEALFAALQEVTHAKSQSEAVVDAIVASVPGAAGISPTYGRQQVQASFEKSSLAITLLFVGGILLEIMGVLLISSNSQSAISLCFAGFVAVITSIILRRQRSKGAK
jgi:hypothetical protein